MTAVNNDFLYSQYNILQENLTQLSERLNKLEAKYEVQHPEGLTALGLSNEFESFEKIYHETQKNVSENIAKLQVLKDHYEELNGKFNMMKLQLDQLNEDEKEAKNTAKHIKVEVLIFIIGSLLLARNNMGSFNFILPFYE